MSAMKALLEDLTFAPDSVRYVCKLCGAESPTGIGYACQTSGPLPEPAVECPGWHAGDRVPAYAY